MESSVCGKVLEELGLQGWLCGEVERGCNQVSGGEAEPGLSRDIPRGTVVHGDPRWGTGGVRSKQWHRGVAAHSPQPLAQGTECHHWLWHSEQGEEPGVMLILSLLGKP